MTSLVFKRVEYKYLLNRDEYLNMLSYVKEHMKEDRFGESTIQSLYYDTPDYLLIRRSLEKPVYKEKLRLRSYNLADESYSVFLEIKKKSQGVVYKRRITLKENEAVAFMQGDEKLPSSQIANEISYFKKYYGMLRPAMLLLYDRLAFFEEGTDLRITFDRNIRYRNKDLNLHTSLDGIPLFNNGEVMVEIKATGAFPMWLVDYLSKNKIRKTSFSKYGTAYTREYKKQKFVA